MKDNILQQLTKADLDFFRPVPFWSINSDIEEEEIVRQIGEMHAYGLGGFVFHARTGLVTEYLSKEWFYLVGVALKTAKEYGMKVWIYDENGWPSGFVGGKLLAVQEYRAKYLRYKKTQSYDNSAYLTYIFEDGKAKRIDCDRGECEYHNIYLMTSDSYTDILDPRVTEAFIRETYDKYFERFPESFGKELIGFFTDEPQYYRAETPYPGLVEQEFAKAYGENVRDGLIYLFVENENGYPFRVKYYNLLNRMYCENYYAKLQEWCEEHGCLLTGHSVEETFFTTQMWGGADCATSYMYEHIPAIDNLGKYSTAELSAKSLGSVCAQIGNPLALTETFGVSGYSVTPLQLRAIADKQYVYGVNMMVQHLYNYSFAGQGKIDCPPSFGRMMPWVSGYREFNEYFARLGYLIANSEEETEVAVITPMESVYLNYVRKDETRSHQEVDDEFFPILEGLRRAGIPYHFVNEKVAEKLACVREGRLTVGKRTYSAVVLANCEEIKSSTFTLLQDYLAQGGKLWIAGRAPRFVEGERRSIPFASNCGVTELPKPYRFSVSGDVSISCRKLFGKEFMFIVNQSCEDAVVTTEEEFSRIDLTNMRGYQACRRHTVNANSSVLLERKGNYTRVLPEVLKERTYTPTPIAFDDNTLTIEKVLVTLKDGSRLCGYVYGVFETLCKRGYEGRIKAEFTFESDVSRGVELTVEKQSVEDLRFNGERISFTQSPEDVNFLVAEVTAVPGVNVYSYEADFSYKEVKADVLYDENMPESILNMTTYHTQLEQIYVSGKFETEGYKLVTPSERRAGDLTVQGYDNFSGAVTYKVQAAPSDGAVYIQPKGDFSQCIVKVDGKEYRVLLQEGVWLDCLCDGEIIIECYSTLRNKIGPFHFIGTVDNNVCPDMFTLRYRWTDEKTNEWYSEERRLVPFGLREVGVGYAAHGENHEDRN